MKLNGYSCEHPTIAGKPCAICATHYPPQPAERPEGNRAGPDRLRPGSAREGR